MTRGDLIGRLERLFVGPPGRGPDERGSILAPRSLKTGT